MASGGELSKGSPAWILPKIPLLDEILAEHAGDLGEDFTGYRNHTYRMANLCAQFAGDTRQIDKIGAAAAFHDLGVWTNHTFDYLGPSVQLAAAWLGRSGRSDWVPEVTEMILQHHKLSRWRGDGSWLVEPFRRADWTDVSRGIIRFGLPRGFIRELYVIWPSAGFHRRLVALELARLRTHPWSPLPMLRW